MWAMLGLAPIAFALIHSLTWTTVQMQWPVGSIPTSIGIGPSDSANGVPNTSLASGPDFRVETASQKRANQGPQALSLLERDFIDREFSLVLVANSVGRVADQIRRMVVKHGGQVAEDVEERAGRMSARFTVRIDSTFADALLSTLASLGQVGEKRVHIRDISRELYEADVQLNQLSTTIARYDHLIFRATTIREVLAIEAERAKILASLERARGTQIWLRDRVHRSTLSIRLSSDLDPEIPAKW